MTAQSTPASGASHADKGEVVTENKTREWFWRDEFRTLLPDGRLIRNARIAKSAPRTPRGVLLRAADIIERKGLARGVMRDEYGCRCTWAAILEAVGLSYSLEEEVDVGHLDARQVNMRAAIYRFALLQDTVARIGLPNCWGDRQLVGAFARWSDLCDKRQIVRMLRAAARGDSPKWEWRVLDKQASLAVLR